MGVCNRQTHWKLVLLWVQLTKIYPPLPTSVQPISMTKTLLIVMTKNERDPPLFTGKLMIKFQNILRNTTQVIIRHGKNPIFRQTDGHGETSIPPYNFVAGEIKIPIGSYVKTMSADGDHLRTIHAMFALKLTYWFQRRRLLNFFSIGSYVKTMSTDGGHLGWSFGSLDIILKVDHLRTIHAMFALNWLTGFRGDDLHFIHRVLC